MGTVGAPARFDVVVVHYGEPEATCGALERLADAPAASRTIVDNAGNLSAAPAGVRVLRPGTNLGFGRGANHGVAAGAADFVLLLNPDMHIDASKAVALVEGAMAEPTIAALAPRLVYPDGTSQVNGGRLSGWVRELARCSGAGARLRGLRARLRREAAGTGGIVRRPWVTGAALLLRRDAFEQIGGFDERYFLYYEDEDLCRRLGDRGWRCAVDARVSAVHAVGGSQTVRDPYSRAAFLRSRTLYHQLHSGPLLRRLVAWHSRLLAARASSR